MICVECGRHVRRTFRDYGGGNIRLTRCVRPRSAECLLLSFACSAHNVGVLLQDACGLVADKYVEFEMVLIFIDLVLLKVQAYRHLLFNRLSVNDTGVPVRVAVRVGCWGSTLTARMRSV